MYLQGMSADVEMILVTLSLPLFLCVRIVCSSIVLIFRERCTPAGVDWSLDTFLFLLSEVLLPKCIQPCTMTAQGALQSTIL